MAAQEQFGKWCVLTRWRGPLMFVQAERKVLDGDGRTLVRFEHSEEFEVEIVKDHGGESFVFDGEPYERMQDVRDALTDRMRLALDPA